MIFENNKINNIKIKINTNFAAQQNYVGGDDERMLFYGPLLILLLYISISGIFTHASSKRY